MTKTILFACGDMGSQEQNVELLRSKGYEVQILPSEQAIAQLAEGSRITDLLILDRHVAHNAGPRLERVNALLGPDHKIQVIVRWDDSDEAVIKPGPPSADTVFFPKNGKPEALLSLIEQRLAPPTPAETRSSGETKFALVVDDDPVQRKLRGAALTKLGFTVLPAISGKNAEEMLETHPNISLVATDCKMETDIAGIDLIKFMRCKPDLKQIPVIMVSSEDERELRRQIGSLTGNNTLLPKTATREAFLNAVTNAINPVIQVA